ncbi:MAG: hypothetical protein QF638_07170 [Acidimicrobiales bacterium]|jgi:hypothetical protein|nr:hypothetical protein [Acidimicrobiaceae bacterium]MDP6077953.1 hypothetical protein [Acidimicrobiales bacterium]MDP7257932.1 hypothetical protein [Acidimicrobiales bacterium]HCV35736.1 hypothetical protein [Acidimicrobiaceae bacterium]HJO80338.1 hypothetical protein [Acidimicrobiales bacterium]|tara:strand:+ start:2975 stop:3358 length:384 start_codon:yes stop_codon:yes gene_type:complete
MRSSIMSMVVVVGSLLVAACGDDKVSEPSDATTCVELTKVGRVVAGQVLESLAGQTLANLEADNPEQPFAAVDRLMRTSEFEDRARQLGCGRGELEVAACLAYQGLAQQAEGDLALEYLAPYFTACG